MTKTSGPLLRSEESFLTVDLRCESRPEFYSFSLGAGAGTGTGAGAGAGAG